MKILGIAGSPRKGGSSELLVREALKSAQEKGAEAELVLLRRKNIKPCDACYYCLLKNIGTCHIKDDMQTIYPKLKEADGIIIASPTHFGNVSGLCQIFLERTECLQIQPLPKGIFVQTGKSSALAGKAGSLIVTGRRRGVHGAANTLAFYFMMHRMVMPHAGVHGFCKALRPGAILEEDPDAVKMAAELGRDMVAYLKKVRPRAATKRRTQKKTPAAI